MKAETRSFYVQVVQRVVEHVAQHLDEALALDLLAARACLSPFHFHRVFRGMVGETPVELARRLRIERAAWQLAHTPLSVTAIAFNAGFETHEAFTRAFRSCYGAPPSDFADAASVESSWRRRAACISLNAASFHPSSPETQEVAK